MINRSHRPGRKFKKNDMMLNFRSQKDRSIKQAIATIIAGISLIVNRNIFHHNHDTGWMILIKLDLVESFVLTCHIDLLADGLEQIRCGKNKMKYVSERIINQLAYNMG